MKAKLAMGILLVLSARTYGQKDSTAKKISAQIEIGSYLGKLYNLHTVSGAYKNDGKGFITPFIKAGITNKKILFQVGFINQIHHTFNLDPKYISNSPFDDSVYGQQDLQKKMGYKEWQFMVGRIFDLKQNKLQLMTSVGYTFARLTQGKDEFRGIRPLALIPNTLIFAPTGEVFGRKVDAILIEAKVQYRFTKHWYVAGNGQFRAMLKYIDVEETDPPLGLDPPSSLFYKKFLNGGMSIGYSF